MGNDGNTSSLGEVINKLIDSYRLRDKLHEAGMEKAWEKVMGMSVVNRTDSLKLQGKKLIIRLTSAPLRQELSYRTEEIRKEMNKELGENYLEEVIFR
jgi:predicted nucleic acid-binding Zn ribbon protein